MRYLWCIMMCILCPYSDEHSFDVLPNCTSYLQVRLKRVTDGGDHDVAICEVVGNGVWDNAKQTVDWQSNDGGDDQQPAAPFDPSSALYTGQLRAEGII